MFVKEIVVTGDSGADYKIDYDSMRQPRCSCPAFSNRKQAKDVCKHIVYISERVLKKPRPVKATASA